MKNINLIPTDKPSRLHNKNGELGNYPSTKLYIEDFKGNQHNSFHIYITSDEEIKEGDWVIYNNELKKSDGISFKSVDKKIILTTDGDLIKDGVQAIDIEFLEWFVKNPSCEWIEVVLNEVSYVIEDNIYKTIIPKEEPKDVVLGYKTSLDAQMLDRIEPKQETLEEAAENFVNSTRLRNYKVLFIEGAKWNQEQILQFLYSEITERRPYSSSKMCEKVIEFIEQLNTKK